VKTWKTEGLVGVAMHALFGFLNSGSLGREFGKETPMKNGNVIIEVHRINEAAIMPIMSRKMAPIASVTFDSESAP
jgi:hypothetical protein